MKSYPLQINNIEYMVGGPDDIMGSPPSARGFTLNLYEPVLKEYTIVYKATEENGYGFILYSDGKNELILKGTLGSDHAESILAKNKELKDIRVKNYPKQSTIEFLRKTCLSGRSWLVNLNNVNYYFVAIWNSTITQLQYETLMKYLKKFPKQYTYIQMGLLGSAPSSKFTLVSQFVPKFAIENRGLTDKEAAFIQTAHMRTPELPAGYAKALKKLQSMTETTGLKEIVNEVIKESAEQSLIPFQQVAQSTNSVEDFMKKLVGKKLKNLLDATSFARLYVMNKYGIGSSFDNQDIQVLVSNLIESATAFINFRRLDPMGKQRDEHDKIIRSTPEYNEWNKKRSIALKNYFNAQKTGDQFAIDKARKEKDDVMSADPTLVDYRKTMADMEKLVKDFHNSPLTLQDVLPSPDDSDKDKQRWQTVEKNFNKLKDRISMNEISDFETYKKYQEYALKLIAKLEKIKLLGKAKTPASDIVTQSSVDTVLIGLGKQFPKLTAKLKELHKYSFHYSDLVKLHQKGKIDVKNWTDTSLSENAEMAQSDVNKIIKYSDELQSMFDVNDNLEDWVKAKLNHACDYVATVRDYLKFYRDEKEAGTSEDQIDEKWTNKYKKTINCSNPKGFSQKAHCRARKLRQAGKHTKSKPVREIYKEVTDQLLNEFNSSMAMGALKQLNNDAKELESMLQPNTQLEDWVKAKLNLAGEYLDDVYHHLDHFGPEGRTLDESSYYKKYWFTPTGKVVDVGNSHEDWIKNNDRALMGATLVDTYENAINKGYVRGVYDISSEFLTLSNLPNYDFSSSKLRKETKAAIEDYIINKNIKIVATGKGKLLKDFMFNMEPELAENLLESIKLKENWRALATAAALGFNALKGGDLQAATKQPNVSVQPNVTATSQSPSVNKLYSVEDVIAATLVDEAGGEKNSTDGMQAVLNVIMNRVKGDTKKAAIECLKPYQFSGWNKVNKKDVNDIKKFIDSKKNHSKFKVALDLVNKAKSGSLKDITKGANHFLNIQLTKQQRSGGNLPSWYDKNKVVADIGKHQFLKLESLMSLGEYFGFNYYF